MALQSCPSSQPGQRTQQPWSPPCSLTQVKQQPCLTLSTASALTWPGSLNSDPGQPQSAACGTTKLQSPVYSATYLWDMAGAHGRLPQQQIPTRGCLCNPAGPQPCRHVQSAALSGWEGHPVGIPPTPSGETEESIVWTFLGSLYFHINFQINCQFLPKTKSAGILGWHLICR